MPMRQFKKTKRILTREEQLTLHEKAKAAAQRDREEKQRLIAEGKLRRELIKVDARTTIVRYIPIEQQNE
jgi:ribosomal protein L15